MASFVPPEQSTAPQSQNTWEYDAPLKNRMRPLFESREWTDLTLVLHGENDIVVEEVPVHKLILRAGSATFNRKITPEVVASGKLRVDNVDPTVYKLMVSYLYTGNATPSILEAIPLQKLATEYGLPYLTQICKDVLQAEITEDNALAIFEAGMEFVDADMIESSLGFICKNAQRILKREEFSKLRMECLIEIIQENRLQVVNEMEVFDAVYRWGEAECIRQKLDIADKKVLRKVLSKPLMSVRFPLMDSEQFALNVASRNILDLEECVALLICFLVSPEKRGFIPHGRFSSSPRSWILPEADRSLSNNYNYPLGPLNRPALPIPALMTVRFPDHPATPPAPVRNSYLSSLTSMPPIAQNLEPWQMQPTVFPDSTQGQHHRHRGDIPLFPFHDDRNTFDESRNYNFTHCNN